MGHYRKIPVTIEAIQLRDDPQSLSDALEFVGAAAFSSRDNGESHCVLINTLEGVMRADVNDWIIKGVKGEFYPCKPDIFAATYVAVE